MSLRLLLAGYEIHVSCAMRSFPGTILVASSLPRSAAERTADIIVGLNVALKGPFPLVKESEVSRESDVSRTNRENYKFI